MANPPRAKGTGGENEIIHAFARYGIKLRRTSAGCPWDLENVSHVPDQPPIEMLATRPDRGEWLVSLRLSDMGTILQGYSANLHVESKRYARFALHRIFAAKFGRGKG